jgi:hypothetical protein
MKIHLVLTALLSGFVSLTAQAQTPAAYPAKPIKIVVPFPAGGTSDVLARLIGQKMTEAWGQPVVIDNKPGSSGNLGALFYGLLDLPATAQGVLGSAALAASAGGAVAICPDRGVRAVTAAAQGGAAPREP